MQGCYHSCETGKTVALPRLYTNNKLVTVAINELLCLKNVGIQILMFFTSYEQSAPMAIEKIKIRFKLQLCQSSPFTSMG